MSTPPTTHTARRPADTVAAGIPPADGGSRYLETLREIGARGATINTALVDAHLADGPRARADALTELHLRIRAMAALANDALGGWPEQPDEQEPL